MQAEQLPRRCATTGRLNRSFAAMLRWDLVAVFSLTLLWRLPSLFDPPWVNDEGTYFAVAQAMAHGFRLYVDVWENKFPGIYLMYAAVYHLIGPSLLAVRLLATISVLLTVGLVFLIASAHLPRRAGLAAALLTGFLMGTPFLEGTTANAEVFLAALAALAVYLGTTRNLPMLAGIAIGLAILFKAVAGFDACALGLWYLMRDRPRLLPYATGLAGLLALGAALAWWAGILHAMLRDALLYDLGYVGHANGAGLPWLLLVKVGVLVGLTVLLRRAPFPYLWLAYAAAGAVVSGRFFGHYALQAVSPLTLSLAELQPSLPRRRPVLVLIPCLFAALAILSAAVGWSLAATGHDSILVRRLQYYANFARYALGTESYSRYRSQVDDHVDRNLRVIAMLRHMPPGRLLVWGNTPWLYPLSGRLPATPYTSALRQPVVPGETSTLRQAVVRERAGEVVLIRPPSPPLGHAALRALRMHYRPAGTTANVVIYARRGPRSRR